MVFVKDSDSKESESSGSQIRSESNDTSAVGEKHIDAALCQLRSDLASLEMNLLLLNQQRKYNLEAYANHEIQKLEEHSILINLLGCWLETEIFAFSQTAKQLDSIHDAIQHLPRLAGDEMISSKYRPLIEIKHSVVPTIVKKKLKFTLTSRSIALHKPE